MKYYIPFFYTFKYNRKGLDAIAYFLEYVIALFVLVLLFGKNGIDIFIFLLALAAFTSIYEVGYLENNVQAVKQEKTPTIRHTESEFIYLEENYTKIVFIRYIVAIVLTIVLSFWIDVGMFLLLLSLTRVSFYLYNMKFREGFIHRLLFMVLRFFRYFTSVWFLGAPAFIFAFIISFVNLINNFAWYDRWGVQLHRFFGTKLFDALVYTGVYIIFIRLNNYIMAYFFLFFAIIKLVLFLTVLLFRKA
jgi:hypothetical protein